MPNTAIKVSHLTKVYKLYDKPIDRLKESLHPLKKQYHKDFYALNDVSFEIKKGETVGIIGKNGAGKSTLLKIITGVLTPSSGHVHVNGRIASLLELGAGFNPEYTGIENIYLQGTLMGYSHSEMESKIDGILAFADIGDFVHQPVKSYSSGMYARLAFSVAINVEPDILIVDEALSVGDMYFQQKCMDKIISMQKNNITFLFVSHSIAQIKKVCKKAIFIQNGKLIAHGESLEVCDLYLNQSSTITEKEKQEAIAKSESNNDKILQPISSKDVVNFFRIDPDFDKKYTERSGGGEFKYTAVDIYNDKNQIISETKTYETIRVVASCISTSKIAKGLVAGLLCRDQNGNDMFASNFNYYNIAMDEIQENSKFIIEWVFDFPLLHGINGIYTFSIGAKPHPFENYYYDRIFNVAVLKIYNPEYADHVGGLVYIKPKINILQHKQNAEVDSMSTVFESKNA